MRTSSKGNEGCFEVGRQLMDNPQKEIWDSARKRNGWGQKDGISGMMDTLPDIKNRGVDYSITTLGISNRAPMLLGLIQISTRKSSEQHGMFGRIWGC